VFVTKIRLRFALIVRNRESLRINLVGIWSFGFFSPSSSLVVAKLIDEVYFIYGQAERSESEHHPNLSSPIPFFNIDFVFTGS